FDIAISGWSVNPDPEEVLATHLCSRRPTPSGEGGGTESFYCDKQYEELYQSQLKELDTAKRADMIKQMQQRLYTDAPVIAIYYPNNLELYRKDKITSITPIPSGKQGEGILYGGASGYPMVTLDAKAVATGGSGGSGGGSNTGLIIGVVAAAVVVLGGAGFLLSRRRKTTSDERE
ncbi:ABC transporter substrate-binding protein, partial [Nonomuraea sp. NPDC059194]